MTYTLADFGSFHVGGRWVEVSGRPPEKIQVSAVTSIDRDPNGRYLVEQLYVQYFSPAERRSETPVVLLHGGGLSGVCWETTPDGRPGWLHAFLRAGYPVYVIDNVERGRSGFAAVEGVWPDQPIPRSIEETFWLFRFGFAEGFDAANPAASRCHPGQRFPIAHIEQFCRQFVPRWTSTTEAQTAGVIAALERIGPCHLICHSQGGQIAANAAMARPDLVASFIGLEASGFPDPVAITPRTAGAGDGQGKEAKRWLYLIGDFVDITPRWRTIAGHTADTVARLKDAGADARLVSMPEQGFPGMTHMMMMDENSDAVAAWVMEWLG